jgi:hypothetical protein
MKIFNFSNKPARGAKFQESHFRTKLERILWENEEILSAEFVKEGNDSTLASTNFKAFEKQESTKNFAGHPFHFLATSNWRCFIGFPGSGLISSYAFARNDINFFVDENGPNLCIAVKYEKSTEYQTYVISKDIAVVIKKNLRNEIPKPAERTKFIEYPEYWGARAQNPGQELLATIAAKSSGSDYATVKECEACGFSVFSPEKYPVSFFNECHDCLRENS